MLPRNTLPKTNYPFAQALPAAEGLQLVLWGAVRTFVTLLMSLGVPAALGAVRAMLSGEGQDCGCSAGPSFLTCY